ncbi:MAG: alanine racemase [Fusicatenibacter sp.]
MTILNISEPAIRNNICEIRLRSDSRIIAVIKENGYGIGLVPFYRILKSCGIDFFAVSSPAEAFALRSAGCEESILLLTPELSVNVCEKLLASNIILMLGSLEQADVLKEASRRSKVIPRIHLAIDTGLGRYGFPWDALENLRFCTSGMQVEGCYTHFSTASRSYVKNIRRQNRRFWHALSTLDAMNIPRGITHVSESRAFLSCGDLGCDAIRIGSLLLGCCQKASDAGYQRAVWLETTLYQKMLRHPGDSIGYDGTLIRKKDTLIGLVQTGYRDGVFVGRTDTETPLLYQFLRKSFHRITRKKEGHFVLVNGVSVPVIGKIGMNHMLLDLSGGDFLIGDPVRIEVNPLFVPERVPRVFLSSMEAEKAKPCGVLTGPLGTCPI